MDEFLKELEELLRKHKATILRSANSTHDLVISVPEDGVFCDIHFSEEIAARDVEAMREKRNAR